MLYTLAAVLFVEMDNGLGIALRAITVAAGFEIRAQLLVVVDFTVVNNPEVLVLVRDWLVPCLDVNNAQSAHSQSNVALHKEPVVIRTTVHDLRIHMRQRVAFHVPARTETKNSANSAHLAKFLWCRQLADGSSTLARVQL